MPVSSVPSKQPKITSTKKRKHDNKKTNCLNFETMSQTEQPLDSPTYSYFISLVNQEVFVRHLLNFLLNPSRLQFPKLKVKTKINH